MTGLTFSEAYQEYKKTHNKNIFEEVIDGLMIDKYSHDAELTEYIKSLPTKNKRMAILSLLDNDNSLWKELKLLNDSKISKIDHLKDIIRLFRKFIPIAKVEQKRHGEVMTPFDELARPMVDLVSKYDDNFWKDPNNKVMDSSAGIGTFLVICAANFMNGLKKWEPDDEKRYKHIVENCLYFGELQPHNVFLYLCALDPNDEYKLNIYWGDFLSENFNKHMKDVWEIEELDMIIQNPPYQLLKDGFKKSQPLWHLFVKKSLSLLKEDGYMIMVHPGGWRNVDGVFKETQNLLKNKQIFYLKLHSFKQGQNMFGAAINFDYYFLKNSKNVNFITEIECVDKTIEKIDISKLEFISDENITEIQKLVAKEGEEKVNLLHSYSSYEHRKIFLSRDNNNEYKYPIIYGVKSPEKGNIPSLYYSSRNDRGHFGISKVIFGKGASGVLIDKDGNYGLTEFAQAIIDDKENLENIKKALLNVKFIKNIMGFKHSLGDKYNKKIISMLRKDFWREFI